MVKAYERIYTIINSPKVNTMKTFKKVKICKVNEYVLPSIRKNMKFRAGVIPYTLVKGKVYFAFGVDTKFKELTDFGGGVKKGDDNVINGGIREFIEESLAVFEPVCKEDLDDTIVMYTKNMLILFIYYPVRPKEVKFRFNQKMDELIQNHQRTSFEVKDIVWLDKDQLNKSLIGRGNPIYSRVRNMFNNLPICFESFINFLTRFSN